jgi:deoxyribodipyrimidine photo-lyase
LRKGRLPHLDALLGDAGEQLPEPAVEPGEQAARAALGRWLDGPIDRYADRNGAVGEEHGTSRLSPYLRWGCVSAARRRGLRRLARRPHRLSARRCRDAPARPQRLDAQRARLVVGSFLTKDLHLDWRLGERQFEALLLDGEPAQNNGDWQWVTSVGVDPAPYFRRMFNPVRQQQKFDPAGEYVRRWVPELRADPGARLAEPWTMSDAEQAAAGCVIGRDYPAPIVVHEDERRRAIERYRAAG